MSGTFKTLLAISFLVLTQGRAIAVDEIKATPVERCPENSAPCVRDIPGNAMVSERLFGLPGLPNAGRVATAIYRGAQPTKEGYATLKKMGIFLYLDLTNQKNQIVRQSSY